MSLLPAGWVRDLDLDDDGRLWLVTTPPDDDARTVCLGPVDDGDTFCRVAHRLHRRYYELLELWLDRVGFGVACREEVLATYREGVL